MIYQSPLGNHRNHLAITLSSPQHIPEIPPVKGLPAAAGPATCPPGVPWGCPESRQWQRRPAQQPQTRSAPGWSKQAAGNHTPIGLLRAEAAAATVCNKRTFAQTRNRCQALAVQHGGVAPSTRKPHYCMPWDLGTGPPA